MRATEPSLSGEPEPRPRPRRELTDEERALALARIANRWRQRYMDAHDANKSDAFRATGLGSRNTVDRVLNADLAKGKPKPESVRAMAKAWGGDYTEAARVMDWSGDGGGVPARSAAPQPPASVHVRRVLALLEAPDEIVDEAQKRQIIARFKSIWREYVEEARATGRPVLSDVERTDDDRLSDVDNLDRPTG